MQDRLRSLAPAAILALGWLWFVAYAYPGQITWDGVDQLAQARRGVYSDDQPPVFIAIWHALDVVVQGPLLMLLLQAAAFTAGLYLVFRRTFAPLHAAIATTAIFVFPPVMTAMALVWKDNLMAGLLVLAIGLLLQDTTPGRRRVMLRGAAIVAMFVATAVRYNAAAATFVPILFMPWRASLAGVKRYAVAVGVWLAITAAALLTNAALTDNEMSQWHTTIAVFDIAGTIAHVDDPISDAELADDLAGSECLIDRDIQAAARAVYSSSDYFKVISNDPRALWHVPVFTAPSEAQRDGIAHAWKRVVWKHPVAWLEHRFAVMREVLTTDTAVQWRGEMKPDKQPERARMGLLVEWEPYQLAWTRRFRWLEKHTPLFAPWLYLLLALSLIPFAWRHRDLLVLVLSGLGYEASFVLLACSHDYRYSHWMIVTTCVAAVALTARRRRAKVAA